MKLNDERDIFFCIVGVLSVLLFVPKFFVKPSAAAPEKFSVVIELWSGCVRK